MNLFRVRGIRLAIHFTLFPLLALAAFEGWMAEDGGGWSGVAWSVGLLLAIFSCVVLHELGHSLVAMRFGVRVPRILLMPIGGMAELDDIPREPSREFLIAIAGPAVNFALIGMLWLAAGWPPQPFFSDYPATLRGCAHLLIHWNLMMGVFNLLPAFPMDGGRILRALFALRLPYLRATFWAALTGKTIAVGGILFAAFGDWSGASLEQRCLRGALFTFVLVAGEIEYRAIKRREIDEAHWRATLPRFGYAAATAEALPPAPLPSSSD